MRNVECKSKELKIVTKVLQKIIVQLNSYNPAGSVNPLIVSLTLKKICL